jgi:hypothetical protein
VPGFQFHRGVIPRSDNPIVKISIGFVFTDEAVGLQDAVCLVEVLFHDKFADLLETRAQVW